MSCEFVYVHHMGGRKMESNESIDLHIVLKLPGSVLMKSLVVELVGVSLIIFGAGVAGCVYTDVAFNPTA